MYKEPVYLQTAQPKSANIFIGRLQEVEKIQIRKASSDELEHLRQTTFATDVVTAEVMQEVRAKLLADYATHYERTKDNVYITR